MTQMGGEDLVVVDYYNLNNNGFGAMYRFPVRPPAGEPPFHNAFAADNPAHRADGQRKASSTPSACPSRRYGMTASITPFTHGREDEAADPIGTGGKKSTGWANSPTRAAAPGGDLLAVWTPRPHQRPQPPDAAAAATTAGLYLIPNGGR